MTKKPVIYRREDGRIEIVETLADGTEQRTYGYEQPPELTEEDERALDAAERQTPDA
jgi:hypothetical protein